MRLCPCHIFFWNVAWFWCPHQVVFFIAYKFYINSISYVFHRFTIHSIAQLVRHFSILVTIFFVLNLTYGFSHCDWLNSSKQCIFLLVSILVSSKLQVLIMKHTIFFIKTCLFFFWILPHLKLKDNQYIIPVIL